MSDTIASNPYDQLISTFEELENNGIVARADFWCCLSCAYAD